MALWRLFVSETELALRRRTPDFRGRKEVLPFVRGALTRKGRFNASVGDRSRLECDFSELDNDHDWQRLIRAGIRETANQLRTSTHDRATAELLLRCRRVDIRMADVSVLNRSNARRIDLNIGRLGKNRHAVHAARLAAAVLGEPAGLGAAGRIPRDTAIATGLRVSTPLLFERMLAGCLPADFGFQLVTNGEAVALRSSEPARKVPDLLLVPAAVALPSVRSAIAVVDAKYKMRVPALMSQMGMADQYQQFAYAVVSRRPTLFLYAASPDASAALLDSRLTNSPEPAQHLGLAAIPFPGPTEQSWRSALGSSLLGPIAEFAIRIEAHLRQPA
jgi:5-methylcytosine-specific restriction endonuclease McrBC regulatory subunit McrC